MAKLKPLQAPLDPYRSRVLPIRHPVAVYYRQSSTAQIGNISETLQTIDMVEHLERLGWQRDLILQIDEDSGISGSKSIRARPGMSRLFDLIEHRQIATVAAQDVDRFFREMALIETNRFIDVCRRNEVLILTPTFIYDFAHPIQGRFHILLFRELAQNAADYLEFHVKGRLLKARNYDIERGLYTGRILVPGFMVDLRKELPDGVPNPAYRKYVSFRPWADIMLTYFRLFRANDGDFAKTWHTIKVEGPGFPEVTPDMVPEGFYWKGHLKSYLTASGQCIPSADGLKGMLTNVVYIGHWVHQRAIVRWNNHEAIIPLDLFMFAYNRLSSTDFIGEPNPDYLPYRIWRHFGGSETGRSNNLPTYSKLIYSDEIASDPHKPVHTSWVDSRKSYYYLLGTNVPAEFRWSIKAQAVDRGVDNLLLERLKVEIANLEAKLDRPPNADSQNQEMRIQEEMRQTQQLVDKLAINLQTLTNPELVRVIRDLHVELNKKIELLNSELAEVHIPLRWSQNLSSELALWEKCVSDWHLVTHEEKRSLFKSIADYILIAKFGNLGKRITVVWRDSTVSNFNMTRENLSLYRDTEDLQKLRAMVESNVDQVDILRAFPAYTWRIIQDKYAYRFGNGHWTKNYTGKKKYIHSIRWEDTEEAKAEPESSKEASDLNSVFLMERIKV